MYFVHYTKHISVVLQVSLGPPQNNHLSLTNKEQSKSTPSSDLKLNLSLIFPVICLSASLPY